MSSTSFPSLRPLDGPPTPSDAPEAPIALFDSGVGGLTVLAAIAARSPAESTLYVADQAHVPYGGRPLDDIRGFARGLTAHAFHAGAKLVVMACNVSSATYAEEAATTYGSDRVIGVLEPGAAAAARTTRSGRVGVLATVGTVASEAYPVAIERRLPGARVTQVACPRFVPLVESGEVDGAEAEAAVEEALHPLRSAAVDTVVLGCTHYPFLLPVLRRLAPDLAFVDPAEATADEALRRLGPLRADRGRRGRHALFTTGEAARFDVQARAFLADRVTFAPAAARPWTPELAA